MIILMKHLLILSIPAIIFGASAHAQYTYEWESSADLLAHGVYCQYPLLYFTASAECSEEGSINHVIPLFLNFTT